MCFKLISFNTLDEVKEYMRNSDNFVFYRRLPLDLARHTYATMLLNRHVSIETVAKSLGHQNTKITQSNYARLLDKTVVEEVAKAF